MRRELGAQAAVHLLLLGDGGLAQVDQGRGVDVDVEEAGRDRFLDQRADGLSLLCRLGGVLLGADLEVVALDEHRALVAFGDGGGQDAGGVLGRTLVGVAHLRAGHLEDRWPWRRALRAARKTARAAWKGRARRFMAGTVKVLRVSPRPAGQIQLLDRGREGTGSDRQLADQPAGQAAVGLLAEDRALAPGARSAGAGRRRSDGDRRTGGRHAPSRPAAGRRVAGLRADPWDSPGGIELCGGIIPGRACQPEVSLVIAPGRARPYNSHSSAARLKGGTRRTG